MTLTDLYEKRDELVADLQAIVDLEERSDDDNDRFDDVEAQIAALDTEIERYEKVAELAKRQPKKNTEEPPKAPGFQRDLDPYEQDPRQMTRSELRGAALKAAESVPFATDSQRSAIVDKLERYDNRRGEIAERVLLTTSHAYREAWAKAITGRDRFLTSEEQDALARAMSLTDASGGYAVPAPIDPTLILLGDGSTNPFRQLARVVPITTDTWQGLTSTAATASWDAEAAEVSDDTTTFAQPQITAYKAAAFVPASIEITQDYPGLVADLGEIFAQAKDDLEATAFATGSGSAQPYGVVTAVAATAGSRVAATTNNTFGLVDVYAVHEALPAKHRAAASWVANLNIINDIRQFATANNYHGFLTDLAGDTPRQLLGKPLYESSAMDGAIATGDDDVLIYGDFRNYVIADRVGFTVEYIPHLFATANNLPSGQRGWYAHWRVGADSVNDNAFRVLRV